jgi:5-formyltetrahydrofolate cyclo-ligase
MLREEARQHRAALARAMPDIGRRLSQFAGALASLNEGPVAGYLPLRHEADPQYLMQALARSGRVLALPCIAGRQKPLLFRRWSSGDATVLNAYGIAEPALHAEPVVPALVLVPLLAFDSKGHRLGYGGGYYDRTLARLREGAEVIAVGVAFSGQEVAQLPCAAHDHALDFVVTELGIRKVG